MELYNHQQAQARSTRIRVWTVLTLTVMAASLAGCIVCCCLSSTATAARMEGYAILTAIAGGWFAIFALTVKILPDRYMLLHERNVLDSPRETVTGVVSVEPEVLQIPKSVTICKVTVGKGAFTQRLNVRSDKAQLLQDLSGRNLTLHTVHGYIAAFEEPEWQH